VTSRTLRVSSVAPGTKPLDGRIAARLAAVLAATPITPNQVTTVGLVIGMAAAALYALGGAAVHVGAALYVAAGLIDHTDGELARLTGRSTAFGQAYDRIVDLCVKSAVFVGMGIGFRDGPLGLVAPLLGLVASLAFLAIFSLRSRLARRVGQVAFAQPAAGPFEIEDILYLVAPLTWCGWVQPFLLAAAVGAPLFALWTMRQLWRVERDQRSNRRM